MISRHPQRPASYKGRPGSTADLAMGHLEACGPTGEIALASAIDKEAHELHALLSWPIKQGALRKEVVGDEWVFSIGDGVPMVAVAAPKETPPAPDAEPGKPTGFLITASSAAIRTAEKAVKRAMDKAIAKASKPDPVVMKPPKQATKAAPAATDPPPGDTTAPVDETAAEFRIALWSDGILDIRRPGGHLVRFTKAEARALVNYLEAISLDPLREEVPA